MSNKLGYARHWTREGKDPFAGIVRAWRDSREAPENWTQDQLQAWKPLLHTGESYFDLISRVSKGIADGHRLIREEDAAGFADDVAFALSRSYLAWSALLPNLPEKEQPATLAEAERVVGGRLVRSLLARVAAEDPDAEREADGFGVPANLIADAKKRILPSALASPQPTPEELIEHLEQEGRGGVMLTSTTCSVKSWAVINPAPLIEPISQTFDFASYRHAIHLASLCGLAQADSVYLGLANLSGTLLAFDAPYDSPRGLAISASLAGMLMGESVRLSAENRGPESEMSAHTQSALEALLHALEVLNELPNTHGTMDSVRWRDTALKSLKDAAQVATTVGVSTTVQTGTPCRTHLDALVGSAGTGFGAAAQLRDGDSLRGEVKSALQMIGLRGEELSEALDSLNRDEWPTQILEESQAIFRTGYPSPWGQVHPSAQLQRAVDLKPFSLGPTCATIACPGFDEQTVAHLIEAAKESELDALLLIGRGEKLAPLSADNAGEAQAVEVAVGERRLHIMISKQPRRVAFQAEGASGEESGLLNALAGMTNAWLMQGLSLGDAARSLPDDHSWTGAFRAALLAVAETE